MKSGRDKREVVSSNKVDISSLLRGPQGPPVSLTILHTQCSKFHFIQVHVQ